VTSLPPLLLIAGPTATGKTELAIRVAEELHRLAQAAEIISADSRQVYRGLDIGTAKASAADRARVPHHGLDLVDPDAPYSVADFAAHANGVLAALGERRALAIVVGGTGLYLRAIARGLDTDALPHDVDVRARIEREVLDTGVKAAAGRLATIAPRRAERTDLHNPRRVARALELAELAGDDAPPPPRPYAGPITWIGVDADPAIHDEWILDRARGQFAAGLVDEARELRERFDPALPAFSAIGYREAWDVIDGRATLDEAIDRDAQRNRAFARRQRTWFRSEAAIRWLPVDRGDVLPTAVDAACRLLDDGSGAAATRK
jgi:tRNA dimethylallyltransferase